MPTRQKNSDMLWRSESLVTCQERDAENLCINVTIQIIGNPASLPCRPIVLAAAPAGRLPRCAVVRQWTRGRA